MDFLTKTRQERRKSCSKQDAVRNKLEQVQQRIQELSSKHDPQCVDQLREEERELKRQLTILQGNQRRQKKCRKKKKVLEMTIPQEKNASPSPTPTSSSTDSSIASILDLSKDTVEMKLLKLLESPHLLAELVQNHRAVMLSSPGTMFKLFYLRTVLMKTVLEYGRETARIMMLSCFLTRQVNHTPSASD
jgi:hypothetical protein